MLNSSFSGKTGSLELIIRTICVLFKTRPCILTVASLRIALLAIILRPVFHYFMVVDCHYAGVIPSPNFPGFLRNLYSYIHRSADLILVTNKTHADIIITSGGRPFILQDRVPVPVPVPIDRCAEPSGKKKVVCICSYNSDEPIEEILKAAKLLCTKDIIIYLTGDNKGKLSQHGLPSNVILTGYLPYKKYWQLLWESDLIVDLTTRENCLLCGAYEAVAVEKPMVLSDTTALRGYFTRGVVYTENSGADIALSITKALDVIGFMTQQVRELKGELTLLWEPKGEALKETLNELCYSVKGIYQKGTIRGGNG